MSAACRAHGPLSSHHVRCGCPRAPTCMPQILKPRAACVVDLSFSLRHDQQMMQACWVLRVTWPEHGWRSCKDASPGVRAAPRGVQRSCQSTPGQGPAQAQHEIPLARGTAHVPRPATQGTGWRAPANQQDQAGWWARGSRQDQAGAGAEAARAGAEPALRPPAALDVGGVCLGVPGAEADLYVDDAGAAVRAGQVFQLQQGATVRVRRRAVCGGRGRGRGPVGGIGRGGGGG